MAVNEVNRFLLLVFGLLLIAAVACVVATEAKAGDCPNGKCPLPRVKAVWVDATGKALDIKPLDLPAPPLPKEFCPTGNCPLPKAVALPAKSAAFAEDVADRLAVRTRTVVKRCCPPRAKCCVRRVFRRCH